MRDSPQTFWRVVLDPWNDASAACFASTVRRSLEKLERRFGRACLDLPVEEVVEASFEHTGATGAAYALVALSRQEEAELPYVAITKRIAEAAFRHDLAQAEEGDRDEEPDEA